MSPLTKKIEDLQAQLAADNEKLLDDTMNDSDADKVIELTARVKDGNDTLDRLLKVERELARTSTPATVTGTELVTTDERRPFAAAAKKVEPREYVYRGLAVLVKAHHTHRSAADVLTEEFGGRQDEGDTRAVFGAITRAASAPAMTTTTNWAAELVSTAILDFVESLFPNSIYPRLSSIGGRFTFGRNGIISLPRRNATPTIAGSFVGQGAPIPVRQGAFSAVTLTPKKMAVITTLTREMAEHSTPALQGVLEDAIREDTAVAIDTVLLDNTVDSTIRPAGLRYNVSVTTATAGGGFAALVGDIKALVTALITATAGNLRSPVWIMNPIQAVAIGLTQNAGGDFPFKAELAGGTLQGFPVIQSTTVTAGMVILVDGADFFSATGDEPRFDVSDQATLHMEDTTPLPIATGAQGSGVLATPTRSLFQTDSMAIRMLLDMNWALRRTGTLAWTQSVTW
jgi:HK97 family phage major capsid protein